MMDPEEEAQEAGAAEDRLGMTEEQWAWFQKFTHGYGDQDENGMDLSLLAQNLRLTPTERIERNQRALELHQEVRRAGAAAGLFPPDRRP
jgi:hypothetical protein